MSTIEGMELFLVVAWIVLSLAAGEYARRKGRSGVTAVIASLLFSPVLVLIVLAVLPPREEGLIASGKFLRCPE